MKKVSARTGWDIIAKYLLQCKQSSPLYSGLLMIESSGRSVCCKHSTMTFLFNCLGPELFTLPPSH